MIMSISDAVKCDFLSVELSNSEGCTSLDYIMCYPPGIPIVCPGEEITKDVIDFIESCKKNNVNVLCGDVIKVKK